MVSLEYLKLSFFFTTICLKWKKMQENDLKKSIIGENQNALILFWVTFVTSVLSASLGLANCLRVGASRASFNDDGDSDENLAFDISCFFT